MKEIIIGQIPDNFIPEQQIPIGPYCFLGKENLYPGFENHEYECFSKYEYDYSSLDELVSDEAKYLVLQVAKSLSPDFKKSDYNGKFWMALLYPCIGLVVPFLYRKMETVKKFISKYGNEKIKISILRKEMLDDLNFLSVSDFVKNGIRNVNFNELIFSVFFENLAPENWELSFVDRGNGELEQSINQTKKNQSIDNLIDTFLFRSKLTYGFSHVDRIVFHFLFSFKKPLSNRSHINNNLIGMKSKIDWGIDVLKLIIKLLPEEIQNIDVKKPPRNFRSGKLINYSNSLYFNSKSRLDAAFAYLFNEKVIATQHGGHTYGSAMSSEYNKNIEFSTDYFISWGWIDYKNKPFKNILALPSPLLSKHLNKHSKKTETVFFTGTTMNMFLDVFGSWLTENEILKYRKNKAVFIAEYQKKFSLDHFHYRPYLNTKSGLQDLNYLLNIFPSLNYSNCTTKKFHKQLLKANFLIIDHPGTTLNIALSMNIPIFMVWEKEWFPFNERAKRYLEDFEKKNIFFEKPQELVEKISEIIHLYGDIGTWWNQEDIQNLRKSWMDKYGLARKNWRKYWIKQFLELK